MGGVPHVDPGHTGQCSLFACYVIARLVVHSMMGSCHLLLHMGRGSGLPSMGGLDVWGCGRALLRGLRVRRVKGCCPPFGACFCNRGTRGCQRICNRKTTATKM